MIANVEYTDLYCGTANYSWVKRFEFDCAGMTDAQIMRHAKKRLGISGKRALCLHIQCDNLARYFSSTVLFVSFSEL